MNHSPRKGCWGQDNVHFFYKVVNHIVAKMSTVIPFYLFKVKQYYSQVHGTFLFSLSLQKGNFKEKQI